MTLPSSARKNPPCGRQWIIGVSALVLAGVAQTEIAIVRAADDVVSVPSGSPTTTAQDRLEREREYQETLRETRRNGEPDPEGFVWLINREGLAAFEHVGGAEDTWTIDGEMLLCSGRPYGYLLTRRSYRNFILRLQLRYERPPELADEETFSGNSGVLLFVAGESKIWPACVEVQGRNRDLGRVLAIGGAARVSSIDHPEVRAEARHPVGDWNHLEIVAQDGALSVRLNGELVATSAGGELREGRIGLQSEGAEIHFAGLRIKELP